MANKVKFGLKSVHYAKLTSDADGTATFEKPVPIPGGVSLTMDSQGEKTEFYADNMNYFSQYGNAGYSGTLEVARLPDAFRKDILGEKENTEAGTLVENIGQHPSAFALLFEFDGDETATRHVLYNCSASRPSITGNTTNAQKEPAPESISISASGLSNGNVHAQTTKADGTAYPTWYTTVWQDS